MDQTTNVTAYIVKSLADIQKASVLDPQERDSYEMSLSIMNALSKVNPLHKGPIFKPVELVQPDRLPLLQNIP